MSEQETVILSNQIKCLHCGESIYSAHRHDFVTCTCGSVSVDGGMNYFRRAGDRTLMLNQSIVMDKSLLDKLIVDLDEATRTGRNSLGLVCTFVRTLRDEGYGINES